MKARYDGECPLCGMAIYAGQEIVMTNVTRDKLDEKGHRRAVHKLCHEDARNPFRKGRRPEDLTDRWR